MCVGAVRPEDKGNGADLSTPEGDDNLIPAERITPPPPVETPDPEPKDPEKLPTGYSRSRAFFYDQGNTPRCVGFAGALVSSLNERRDDGYGAYFDPNDIYNRARIIYSGGGGATSTKAGIRVLYDDGALVTRSSNSADVGNRKKIAGWAQCQTLTQIKWAIYQKGLCWFRSPWYQNWYSGVNKTTGFLPTGNYVAAGHSYIVVGFSDQKRAFLMQNSYGVDWGVGGRAWIPYGFVNFASGWEAWRIGDVND